MSQGMSAYDPNPDQHHQTPGNPSFSRRPRLTICCARDSIQCSICLALAPSCMLEHTYIGILGPHPHSHHQQQQHPPEQRIPPPRRIVLQKIDIHAEQTLHPLDTPSQGTDTYRGKRQRQENKLFLSVPINHARRTYRNPAQPLHARRQTGRPMCFVDRHPCKLLPN